MVITDINGKQRECVKAYPDKEYPGFIKVEYKNERRSYSEWYPVDEFLAKNPNFDSPKEIKHEAPEITGVVSSATGITLTDKSQSWAENAYAGFPVWIARGKGEGQVRNVISNTKDTLVIDKQWENKPQKFSQYVLSRNIHEQMSSLGNKQPQQVQHQFEIKARQVNRTREKARRLVETARNEHDN